MTIVGVINHGCPKNLVDTEVMLGYLDNAGYKTTLDIEKSDIVLVNTCAFIADAQQESIATIVELIENKKPIIVAGCLPQKFKKELMKELPEIFAFIGPADLSKIADVVRDFEEKQIKTIYHVTEEPSIIYPEDIKRVQITVGSSAYLKIAEGCNYKCAYCVIPQLRGRYHSRSIDNIYKEAVELAQKGVSEIILIAQDTSYYGYDKFGAPILASLLEKLNTIDELDWIRVMYTYPSMINDELIAAMKNCDKVVKYLDIPLQHSHQDVLKRMNRPPMDYLSLIKKLRDEIPNITLRTSLIVGFPGETDEEFEHLYDFVKTARFDRLGVFEFSREEGAAAYSMKPQISAKIKKERKKKIMQLQAEISREINESFIGKKIPVLIESIISNGEIIARSYRDAPEIDGVVYIDSDKILSPGDVEMATIVAASEYDLYAKID